MRRKELRLTDAGRSCWTTPAGSTTSSGSCVTALAELRDNAGRAPDHRRQRIDDPVPAAAHRALPAADIRRSRCRCGAASPARSRAELMEGDLELGRDQLRPRRRPAGRRRSSTPTHLAFIVSPAAPAGQAQAASRSPSWAWRRSSPTTCVSPYRDVVLREFQRHKVPLNMDVEMPTLETIRKLVQSNEGVAFLPRMCVQQELARGRAARGARSRSCRSSARSACSTSKSRTLSRAAKAFLDLVDGRLTPRLAGSRFGRGGESCFGR